MLDLLKNRTYLRLFAAQVIALLGTGLLTIALGLLAFDLAGANAGQVLGIALTVKMVAYVGLSPIATALVARLDRRRVLIAADAVRGVVALCLPFVDATWQIYGLIFVLQAASATFTPTYQAVLPDVLPKEGAYTRALSLSRLAYDLENLASPVLAGLLLTVLAPSNLFVGTAFGFLGSALLVAMCHLPSGSKPVDMPFRARLTKGARIYLATPRLRGLLALNASVSAVGAIVLVLSVVIARSVFAGTEADLAVLLGAYGAGSMVAALGLPPLLDRFRDRSVMLVAAGGAAGVMLGAGGMIAAFGWPGWHAVLVLWGVLGLMISAVMTPSGRLLRRSARAEDRPAVFAAQFALSHLCWLVAYPMAGFLGSMDLSVAMITLGGLGFVSALAAAVFWPADGGEILEQCARGSGT